MDKDKVNDADSSDEETSKKNGSKKDLKDKKDMTALEHNIKTKGENAYYYAHGRKYEQGEVKEGKTIEGPGIITGGNPTLLEKKMEDVKPIVSSKKFEKYAFIDDDGFTQVRIDLKVYFKDVTKITDDCVEANFEEKGMTIRVNEPDGEPHFLVVKKFFKNIKANESSWKLKNGKLLINLKKANTSDEWEKLNA